MEISSLYQIFEQHPSVQTDTRKLQPGDLFFALRGPSFNGNEFAVEALTKGAAYAVIDEEGYAVNERCILVHDVLESLQQLALYHRRRFSIPFIAITGSNGKTTTKELITGVLRRRFITYATEGNLNNHIGVPLTLLSIRDNAELAVIEMGANHQGEIADYCRIAEPDYGIVTNCGKAHIEGFGGIEGVRKGKGELYDFIRATGGTIFRNTDLDYLESMASGISRQITYGSGSDAQYRGEVIRSKPQLEALLESRGGSFSVASQLVGDYNLPNVLVAAAVSLHFGVEAEDVKAAIEGYEPDNSRSQWLLRGPNRIILDAYNANPTSMQAAIENFAAMDAPRKMLWLGGMKEMGGEEVSEHAALAALVARYSWEDVVLVGKEFAGIAPQYRHFATAPEALKAIRQHPPEDATILIKGSRGSRMELLLEALP